MLDTVRSLLKQLPAGTWELVTHPGYNDADLAKVRHPAAASREIERKALRPSGSSRGIELISFAELEFSRLDQPATVTSTSRFCIFVAPEDVQTRAGIAKSAERSARRHAHRHHLLSHLRRFGRGGHGAGHRAGRAGHEVHFISYSQPFRLSGRDEGIFYHEVPVSSYPLFEFPPYDLALASRMAEVAEFYDLDLLHVHYAIPHSVSALLARQMLAARGRRLPFVTTLHGTDITLVGLDRSYLPITRYAIQESDGVTSISNYLKDKDGRGFRHRRGRSR